MKFTKKTRSTAPLIECTVGILVITAVKTESVKVRIICIALAAAIVLAAILVWSLRTRAEIMKQEQLVDSGEKPVELDMTHYVTYGNGCAAPYLRFTRK